MGPRSWVPPQFALKDGNNRASVDRDWRLGTWGQHFRMGWSELIRPRHQKGVSQRVSQRFLTDTPLVLERRSIGYFGFTRLA